MAVFDFNGPDVSNTTGLYNTVFTSGSAGFAEQGITFSFSASTDGGSGGQAQIGGTGVEMSLIDGTATLSVVDTNVVDTIIPFLSNIVFNVSFLFESQVGSIILSNTDASTSSMITIPEGSDTFFTHNITAPVNANGGWNVIRFSFPGTNDGIFLNSITADINCFLTGTQIATPAGETPVEAIKPGDMIRTADGRLTQVKWVGHQEIDARLTHPAKVNPVCIRAGALGRDLPQRDLYLTRDHAIEIDGTLYNAGALINGHSIHRVEQMPREGFSYYHIETEAHDLLLAEGVASETFIDYAGRGSFENGDQATGQGISEMSLPRVSAARMVPDALRQKLEQLSTAALSTAA